MAEKHYHIHLDLGPGLFQAFAILREIQKDIRKMTEASDRLAQEVAETRQAVTDLTGRYQTKIDAMQVEIDKLKAALEEDDTEAALAAADALDALQTEMAQLGQDPPAEPEVPEA